MSDLLTVGELREYLEGISEDESVNIQSGGAVGEATKVTRNADGVLVVAR